MSNDLPPTSRTALFTVRKHHVLTWWRGNRDEVDSPSESLWFDIFLDLALAATYSNLTKNAHVLSDTDTASFVAFFFLLWWIWTSQVAYNARFRRDDWIHRLYLFLQLCLFGALATFTSNFDIGNKIIEDNRFGEGIATLKQAKIASQEIYADYARRSHLPDLNDRGISLTLGFSRLLLFLQYAIAWYRAKTTESTKETTESTKETQDKPEKLYSLLSVIISLLFSAAIYFATFTIIKGGGKDEAILKVALWYSAVFMEILSLYLDILFKDGRKYPQGPALLHRCSILMTVIVGEGLNETTEAFHYIVGNLGFTGSTVLNMLSAAIVIFAIFILYFEGWCWFRPVQESAPTPGKSRLSANFRLLTWVILHILFFCCLSLFMQSLKNILAFQNLTMATNVLQKDLQNVVPFIDNPSIPWDDSSLDNSFATLGLSWGFQKAYFGNETVSKEKRLSDFYWFSGEIYMYLAFLFGSLPSPDSLESDKLLLFDNLDVVSKDDFLTVLKYIYEPRAHSTLWLSGAAGGTLIALAFLNIVQCSPQDKYAWGSVIARFLVGSAVAAVTAMNIDAGSYTVFDDSQKLLWRLLKSGWLVLSLAVIFLCIVAFDYYLIYKAAEHYDQQESQDATNTRSGMPSDGTSSTSPLIADS